MTLHPIIRAQRVQKAIEDTFHTPCTLEQAQEIVAQEEGYPDWSSMQRSAEKKSVAVMMSYEEQYCQLLIVQTALETGYNLQQSLSKLKHFAHIPYQGSMTKFLSDTHSFDPRVIDIIEISENSQGRYIFSMDRALQYLTMKMGR